VTAGRYYVVTRIRDTTMYASRFLSDVRRPSMFTVSPDARETGIAYLDVCAERSQTVTAARTR
jgi:hypothetical protein